MSFYPERVNDRFRTHERAGDPEGSSAEGTSASFICGSFATILLRIDADTTLIEGARFHTNGCGFMTAAADILCESLTARTLGELHGLPEAELMELITDGLGGFPSDRVQCAAVVFEALRTALIKYRIGRLEEFQGEKALVCTCFGVTEQTVVDLISSQNLTRLEDVVRVSRAGSGCGSCRMLIQELIDSRS